MPLSYANSVEETLTSTNAANVSYIAESFAGETHEKWFTDTGELRTTDSGLQLGVVQPDIKATTQRLWKVVNFGPGASLSSGFTITSPYVIDGSKGLQEFKHFVGPLEINYAPSLHRITAKLQDQVVSAPVGLQSTLQFRVQISAKPTGETVATTLVTTGTGRTFALKCSADLTTIPDVVPLGFEFKAKRTQAQRLGSQITFPTAYLRNVSANIRSVNLPLRSLYAPASSRFITFYFPNPLFVCTLPRGRVEAAGKAVDLFRDFYFVYRGEMFTEKPKCAQFTLIDLERSKNLGHWSVEIPPTWTFGPRYVQSFSGNAFYAFSEAGTYKIEGRLIGFRPGSTIPRIMKVASQILQVVKSEDPRRIITLFDIRYDTQGVRAVKADFTEGFPSDKLRVLNAGENVYVDTSTGKLLFSGSLQKATVVSIDKLPNVVTYTTITVERY